MLFCVSSILKLIIQNGKQNETQQEEIENDWIKIQRKTTD